MQAISLIINISVILASPIALRGGVSVASTHVWTVSLVIFGVVEFPVNVRQYSDRGAPAVLLFLVISFLCKHRSTGGSFHTCIDRPIDWVVMTPQFRHRAYQTFVLMDLFCYRRSPFHVEGYSTLAGAR